MAFVITWMILSVLTYEISAGDLHGRQLDAYQVSSLPAPSNSYGFPTQNYVPPQVDYNRLTENYYFNQGTPSDGPSSTSFEHPVNYQGHSTYGSYSSVIGSPSHSYSHGISFDNGYYRGSNLQGGNSVNTNFQGGNSINTNFQNGNSINYNFEGPRRFVGETFRVGKPIISSSRVVYNNLIKKVPVEVTRHVEVDVPQPVPVPVRQEIRVPVPEAYPVISGEVVKKLPFTVYKTQSYEVERPVPYEIVKKVPYPVVKRVKVNIDRPYTLWKKVGVPVKKHVEVPVTVWKPYTVKVIKHVTHYKSEHW